MSNTYYETEKVSLTAYIGNEKISPATQLSLKGNNKYIKLSPSEAFELAMNLLYRISNFDTVTATGNEEGIVLPKYYE